MTRKKNPDSKLTLAECFEKHYQKDRLRPTSLQQFHIHLRWWERLTDNPPVSQIDDDVIEQFKTASLEQANSPVTTKSRLISIRSIMGRLAEPRFGNLHGVGIVPRIPYVRMPKCPRKMPYRIPLADLDKLYLAAGRMQTPRNLPVPVHWWWRSLVVFLYFTGVRTSDAFKIGADDIDLENGVLQFTVSKTGKDGCLPLHSVLIEHLKMVWEPQRQKFFDMNLRVFYTLWEKLIFGAGVERKFTPHDIRRTGCSEIDRVDRGLGRKLLVQAPANVTEASYLNCYDELAEAMQEVRVPAAFKHGIEMTQRADRKARGERMQLSAGKFATPGKPEPSEWKFDIRAFWFRGEWYDCKSKPSLRLLKALALSDEPVDLETLADAVFECHPHPPTDERSRSGRVNGILSYWRERFRRLCYLDDDWDAFPCTERGAGGKWTIFLPSIVADEPVNSTGSGLPALVIRGARKRSGVGQKQLAALLDVSESLVSAWERGKARPTRDHTKRLREVLGPFLNGDGHNERAPA